MAHMTGSISVDEFQRRNWGEIVHVQFFAGGINADWKKQALHWIGDSCSAIAWDGHSPKDYSLTPSALICQFLRARQKNVAIIFKDVSKIQALQNEWKAQLDEFGNRIVIVAVDRIRDAAILGVGRQETRDHDLPIVSQGFLGRIAIKATGSKKVVCMGSGTIGGKEAEAFF